MKQKINPLFSQKPSKNLKNFFSQISKHLKTSSQNLFRQITDNITNLKQTSIKQISQKDNTKNDLNSNHKQSFEESAQIKLPQKLSIYVQKKNEKSLGLDKVFSFIKGKQKQSLNELVQNLKSQKLKPIISRQQRNEVQISSKQENKVENEIYLQKLQQIQKLDKDIEGINVQKNLQLKPSSIEQVEQFCNTLRGQYNQKIYNKDWVTQFMYNLQQIVANNSYICIQDTFQLLKKNYYPEHSSNHNQKGKMNNNSSSKLNHLDTLEFNLQLTIKSRNSKNSFNFEPRDSLTYSNATSFGLQSTQNRSKPLNKNDVSTKFLPPTHSSSLKSMKNKDLNQTDIANIQRTQSRGEVSRQNSRQQTPNLLKDNGKSERILTENEKEKDFQQNPTLLNQKNTQIKKEKNIQVIPLTQQNDVQDLNSSDRKERQQDTNKSPIKKSLSINNYTDRLKLSRNSTSKKIKDRSLFSNQISHFEGRISRIKQAKLAKKLQLQEELKRINNQIEELKGQEVQTIKDDLTKRQKTSNKKSRQNTLQSRIEINDNLEQKKQALKLVRNLKAQKQSRQNQKRKKFQVLNTDLHQQIEDIMRLKYFNQQRVKQKKKLEIIERMKQQQMRKIEQQKRKQESLQFLSKLKGLQRQKAIRDSQKQKQDFKPNKNIVKQQKSYQKFQQDQILQSPNKISRTKQQAAQKTPMLEKKKAYLSRRRNLNFINRKNDDIYEQVLG